MAEPHTPHAAPTAAGACTGSDGRVPLPVLLGRAANGFVAEFERRLAASDFCALSMAHSANVLRHLGEGPLRASQLVDRCGVSKQAVSQQLVHLERNGYVVATPDPADQRARTIALTEKGQRAQRRVEELFTEVEADWTRTLGPRDGAALRRILEKAAAAAPPSHGDC